jgi:AraC-like DNA-binding protein
MQVKTKLIQELPSGNISEEIIAEDLYMSQRSLQRRLREEGTTYKELLNETRRDLAAQYIKASSVSINEITYLLGFSEPSNFSRAFKRWTGVSPSEYRQSA